MQQSGLWCYVILAFHTNFDDAIKKKKIVKGINLPKIYVESGLRICLGTNLCDNQFSPGIQKENEIHSQEEINDISYIICLPFVNFDAGLLLSEVCD